MKKIAVIFFNLGGPADQKSVEPFLFNLFNDPAIIRLPKISRFLIAKIISKRRAPVACAIYRKLGGGSPIVENTESQAKALEGALNKISEDPSYKIFIAMRYWHPFAEVVARDVKNYNPDEIILLPLYPQFSTTTTASSFKDWQGAAEKIKLVVPTRKICCYPTEPGFICALAKSIRDAYAQAKNFGKPRLLFSAHGLPEKIVEAGDPYPDHCRQTVEALRQELKIENLDSMLCYQSRVGPLKWIEPATDKEIERAGHDKAPLVIAPIAFVSDHSETLVEIDIEYRALAQKSGVPFFACAPAVGTAPDFIQGLAQMLRDLQTRPQSVSCGMGIRACSPETSVCPCSCMPKA